MPKTKDPILRLIEIDKIIRNLRENEELTPKKLKQALQRQIEYTIRDSTFYSDLAALKVEPFSLPLEYSRKNKSYYYDYPEGVPMHTSIFDGVRLGTRELTFLQLASSFLGQVSDIADQKEINSLISSLKSKMPSHTKVALEHIAFDQTKSMGSDFVPAFFESISLQHSTRVSYHPFTDGNASEFSFTPFLIKEYNNRWFCYGCNHSENKIWNLALDRLLSVELLPVRLPLPALLQWEQYKRKLEQVVGVTVPDTTEPERIRVWLSPKRAPYLSTKPLHPTQQEEKKPDGSSEFSFFLIPNNELEAAILQFGPDAKVLEPASFVGRIKAKLQAATLHY